MSVLSRHPALLQSYVEASRRRNDLDTLVSDHGKTPIIALTTHALRDERDLCIAAGCDEFLSKPVDYRQRITTIARYLNPA